MTIEYVKNRAHFRDVVSVEDAEALLAWIQTKSKPRIDLADCTHAHPANIQVLMATRPTISAWPRDEDLARWIQSALASNPNS